MDLNQGIGHLKHLLNKQLVPQGSPQAKPNHRVEFGKEIKFSFVKVFINIIYDQCQPISISFHP